MKFLRRIPEPAGSLMITIKWKRGAPIAALVIAYERIKRRGYRVSFINAYEWHVWVEA